MFNKIEVNKKKELNYNMRDKSKIQLKKKEYQYSFGTRLFLFGWLISSIVVPLIAWLVF